jgi:hypothetical protein
MQYNSNQIILRLRVHFHLRHRCSCRLGLKHNGKQISPPTVNCGQGNIGNCGKETLKYTEARQVTKSVALLGSLMATCVWYYDVVLSQDDTPKLVIAFVFGTLVRQASYAWKL